MQEILFSAKRIDNGYMVCGYHVKDGVTGKHFIVAEGSMLHESDKVGEEGLLNFVAFEVDEDTISVTGDGWIPVEKQKPMKPKIHKDRFSNTYNCPKCSYVLIHRDETGWFCGQHYKFCPECGQAIQWEESEEE